MESCSHPLPPQPALALPIPPLGFGQGRGRLAIGSFTLGGHSRVPTRPHQALFFTPLRLRGKGESDNRTLLLCYSATVCSATSCTNATLAGITYCTAHYLQSCYIPAPDTHARRAYLTTALLLSLSSRLSLACADLDAPSSHHLLTPRIRRLLSCARSCSAPSWPA
jgi:hypothetical protein